MLTVFNGVGHLHHAAVEQPLSLQACTVLCGSCTLLVPVTCGRATWQGTPSINAMSMHHVVWCCLLQGCCQQVHWLSYAAACIWQGQLLRHAPFAAALVPRSAASRCTAQHSMAVSSITARTRPSQDKRCNHPLLSTCDTSDEGDLAERTIRLLSKKHDVHDAGHIRGPHSTR
jgi:hypothetical protein